MRRIGLIAMSLLAGGTLATPPPAPPASAGAPADPAEQAQALDAPPRYAPRFWLGVFIEDALDGGIQVVDVVPGGPAARGGLTRGDVLVRADGVDLANIADLRRATAKRAPGDRVTFTVIRGGAATSTAVVLAAPPPPGWAVPRAPAAPNAPPTGSGGGGIELAEIPAELRAHLGAPSGAGLLVQRVDPSSPFAGRVRAGDLLVEIDDTPLDTVALWESLLAARRDASLKLKGVRDRKAYVVEISPAGISADRGGREERLRALEAEIREVEAHLAELKRKLAALESAP